MIPMIKKCDSCGAKIEIQTYRKFVYCPFCRSKTRFEGFDYQDIDWTKSIYSGVKKWSDCPACRSRNMYLNPDNKKWRCPDCGYGVYENELKESILWFCDGCDAYMNVQSGFSSDAGKWKCTECGFENDVDENKFENVDKAESAPKGVIDFIGRKLFHKLF